MSERVTMPALGESVTEGTVTRWLKNVGDHVEVDEPLLEVSTDKVDTEIPSPVAGTLQEILVGEDDTVPVGADLAVIGDGAAAESSGGGDADGSDESGSSAAGGQEQAPAEPEQQTERAADRPEPSTEQSEPEPAPSAQQAPSQDDAQPAQSQDDAQPAQSQDNAQPAQSQDDPQQAPSQDDAQPAQASPPSGSSSEASGPSSASGGSDGTTVTMPALGESVTEGTVTRWLKAEGDEVAVDEPLLEVSTDKVDTEIPSPVAGTLTKILVPEDETVPVGADLAIIGGSGSSAGESGGQESTPAPEGTGPDSSEPQVEEAAPRAEEAASQSEPAQSEPAQSEPAQSELAQQSTPAQQPESAPAASAPKLGDAVGQGGGAAYVTPLVRKLAADNGIDLASLTGTGIGGRVRKQDVLDAAAAAKAAAEAPAPQPDAAPSAPAAAASPALAGGSTVDSRRGTTEKMSRLRQTIAKRMVESLQVSAQLTTVVEVDVTKIARLRARAKGEFERREGTKLSFLPFFALAAVEALKAYPTVNASVDGDQVTYHGAEHLGIAVDTERGLIVPVIRDAGDLNIAGLSRKIADLADRTRTSRITPDELGGGTFTLTNTGSRGALFDTPIINQPQVAILGTGAVVKRPIVVTDNDGGETIAIRSMVYLALSYDHRIVDGADAARFLTAMKSRLEEGAFEASLGL